MTTFAVNFAAIVLTGAYIFGITERTREVFWHSMKVNHSSEMWLRICLWLIALAAGLLHFTVMIGLYAAH